MSASTPNEYKDLQQRCIALEQQVGELTAKLAWYEEQFRLAQHRRFAASSERTHADQQQFVFNEAEAEVASAPVQEEPTLETVTYKRRKQKGQRDESLKDLPEDTVVHELSEAERICPRCGGTLHKMSVEVHRELKIIPAQAIVVKHVREVCTCRSCDHDGISTPVITAPMPKPVIPGSLASPSSLAFIISQKYVESMPLYRQEQQLERLGIELSRQTLANWVITAAERWLSPLYERMHVVLLGRKYLHADETPLQVLHEPGRSAESNSYMWVFCSGRDGPPINLYDYQSSRAAEHPRNFLSTFSGYLHVDGYSAYKSITGVKLVGCWAHARRKFDEALKALPAASRSNGSISAQKGLDFCNRLFAIEKYIKDASPAERLAVRQKRSLPVLEAFKAWLDKTNSDALKKTTLGQAITYCLNQWDMLTTFTQDGMLELDNNRAERTVKPFVIGRKNWLFANTPKGARASAVIYSVVETAKENGLNPLAYLTYIFEQLPNLNVADPTALDKFLPWSENLPANCHTRTTTRSRS